MIVARDRRPGDAVLAAEWNDLLRRVRALENTFLATGAVPGSVPAIAVPFRYKSSDGDVLVCRPYLEGTEVTEDYYLAKPYTHRPSVTTRGSHTYAYTTDFERTDTVAAVVETQVLTPAWEVDDIVYGIRVAYYTGVTYDPGTGTIPIEWLALNDGRAWAVKFGT